MSPAFEKLKNPILRKTVARVATLAQVAVVGGDSFGAPGCIRISYANSDELLVEACKRIKTALENLK